MARNRAGGSGITYTLPQLLNIVRLAKQGKAPVRHISFVWIIRSAGPSLLSHAGLSSPLTHRLLPFSEHISWVSDALESARASCPASVILDIKIFVTRPTSPSLVPVDVASAVPTLSTSERHGSVSSSSSDGSLNEKCPEKLEVEEVEFEHSLGRPDLPGLLKEVIAEAQGGATSITGPSLVFSVWPPILEKLLC